MILILDYVVGNLLSIQRAFKFFDIDIKISNNSKTQVILVRNQKELSFFFKKNLVSDEIIIGMGAGAISNWMRDLRFSL